jgi:uncharacterized damage-inducible protein DinB
VRQRLDSGHAHECRQPEVNRTDLISMALEIRLKECVVLAIEGRDVLEPANARNLFGEHPMKFGVDAMRHDRNRHQFAHRFLDGKIHSRRQFALNDPHDLLVVTIDDRSHQSLLAGEVLVERAYAHARHGGDVVGAGLVEPLPYQNASCSLKKRVNGVARALLRRGFPRVCVHLSGHDFRSECEYQKRLIAHILSNMETTHNTLRHLFQFKAWADDELLIALSGLGEDSPVTRLAIKALSHTYVVDRIFAAHLRGQAHVYTSANMLHMPKLEKLSADMRSSDQQYVEYVSALDLDQLTEQINFEFTDGAPGRMSREEMLMHVITHGIGHRGQVSAVMLLNASPLPKDGFTTYLHDAEASARRRDAA